MRFLHPEVDAHRELALEDVFLLPGHFAGGSRSETDLTPRDFPVGNQPIVSANMTAVTGWRMAESLARYGGLGVLPQDLQPAAVASMVGRIKAADPAFDTALYVSTEASLHDVQGLIFKRAHRLVVVVDRDHRPVGVLSEKDLRHPDHYTPVTEVMTTEVVTVPVETTPAEAYRLMERSRVEALPVVDADARLQGVISKSDAVRRALFRPATDAQGRLVVAAALGIRGDAVERARAYQALGVDALVIDTAHGHQQRMLETIEATRATVGPGMPIIAGNVCTAEGTRDLLTAGATAVKVNVGPGAMCTTRMQTGVGRPTFTTVAACAEAAAPVGGYVWADGGVRYPRDVALYLAAGAARVMLGTWLAGTYESPGDVQWDRDGSLYKESHGMASARAVAERTAGQDTYERAVKALYREGISRSRAYLRPGQESVGAVLTEVVTGVQSAMSYVGVTTLADFHGAAVVGVQTANGYREGEPRGQ
jgi:IMP dehydrogenase